MVKVKDSFDLFIEGRNSTVTQEMKDTPDLFTLVKMRISTLKGGHQDTFILITSYFHLISMVVKIT